MDEWEKIRKHNLPNNKPNRIMFWESYYAFPTIHEMINTVASPQI